MKVLVRLHRTLLNSPQAEDRRPLTHSSVGLVMREKGDTKNVLMR